MMTGPLAGMQVVARPWPAARAAAGLLQRLGAGVGDTSPTAALQLGSVRVDPPETTTEEDWQASGVQHLTGRPGGPDLVPAGRPATTARALSYAIRALGGQVDDGAAILGMRTAIEPLARGGDRSANGSARLLRASDGWVALNLPRPSDLDLVPALLQSGSPDVSWDAVSRWVLTEAADDVVERAAMLGLAVARLGEHAGRDPWHLTAHPLRTPRTSPRPLVVNLGALWAGPLAAHVLHDTGADVVDVHTGRTQQEMPAWRRLLHTGHRTVSIDLTGPGGRSTLRDLLTEADVVIEASRPRALTQLGVDAESIMPDGRERVWLRITGHPRPAERIAYGDDAAVAGGLVARDDHGPVFAGDAMADPLSGLSAALIALACLNGGGAWVADICMGSVAALAVAATDL